MMGSNPIMRVDKSFEKKMRRIKRKTGQDMTTLTKLLTPDINEKKFQMKKKRRKNKRGQISEFGIVIVVLFVLAITMGISWVIGDEIADGLRNAGLNATSNESANAIDAVESSGKAGDVVILGTVVGFTLLTLIAAAVLPTTPIFMAFFLLGGMILWLLSPILSNAWEQFTSSGNLANAAADLTFTNALMSNFPMFATALLLVLIVILFGKRFVFNEG